MLGSAWRSARPWDLFLSRGPFTLYRCWILKGTACHQREPPGSPSPGSAHCPFIQSLGLQRPRHCPPGTRLRPWTRELPHPGGRGTAFCSSPAAGLGAIYFTLKPCKIVPTRIYRFTAALNIWNNSIAYKTFLLSTPSQPQRHPFPRVTTILMASVCFGHFCSLFLSSMMCLVDSSMLIYLDPPFSSIY